MKKPTQARIKVRGSKCEIGNHKREFTKGKWYDIIECDMSNSISGYGFDILDDYGMKSFCLEKGCHHIDGDWELK